MANTLPIKAGHLFIGLAVIMGMGTLAIFTNLGKKPHKIAKVEKVQVETQQIVVPMSTILHGEVIGAEDIKAVAWPKDFLPAGQTFVSVGEVAGRVARYDLYPGEPIYIEKVSGPEGRSGMPAVIPPGLRAVTVEVSEVKAVAGFVKPGDRVDLLVTFEAENKQSVTKTILQNVLILAAAQDMTDGSASTTIETPPGVMRGEATAALSEEAAPEEDAKGRKKKASASDEKKADSKKKADEKKAEKEAAKERARREKERKESEKRAKNISSVTLAVTPEQAQIVTMAESVGSLRLVMRADSDNAVVDVPPSLTSDILSSGGAAKLPEPSAGTVPDLTQSIEMIQGVNKSTVSF